MTKEPQDAATFPCAGRGAGRSAGRGRPRHVRAVVLPGHPTRREDRHRHAVRVEVRGRRQGVHRSAGPGRLRLCRGLTRLRAHPGRPVVDLLPARQLQDRRTARRPRRLRRDGQRLPRRGRQGRRRRRHQPHGGRIRYRHRRDAVQQVPATRAPTRTRTSTAAASPSPTTATATTSRTANSSASPTSTPAATRSAPPLPGTSTTCGRWASTASGWTPPSTSPPPTSPPSRAR